MNAQAIVEAAYGNAAAFESDLKILERTGGIHAHKISAIVHTVKRILACRENATPGPNCGMSKGQLVAFRNWIDLILRERATIYGSPTEIARKSGVSASTVNRPYKNQNLKYTVSWQTIDKIAKQTGILPPAELSPGFETNPNERGIDRGRKPSENRHGGTQTTIGGVPMNESRRLNILALLRESGGDTNQVLRDVLTVADESEPSLPTRRRG